MATQHPSKKGKPVPETIVQQSILQQIEAVIAGQTNPASPRRQEARLQETDLDIPDAAEDDRPPPAYGDTYGEIASEKDGLGTSARVTDDGRVNIRINQLNRRLSQILTPALRQQVQNVQESHPPPPPYIPPSLGGEEGVPPPPPLNVVIQVVGSRGDVQPFVALGKILKNTYGHRVRLATHPNFKGFVQENGLEFFNIGGDPSRLMAFMVKNPGLVPGFRNLLSGEVGQRRRDVAEYIQGCWRSCYQAGDGMGVLRATDDDHSEEPTARPFVADCIIANPPSFAHIHCAEKLGIPLHIMFTMPYSPTQAFAHPLANIQSSNADPQLTNYISYGMIEVLSWQVLGEIINRFRAKCLGLDPVSLIWAPGMLQRLKVPHTYCWSPALIPKPKDWGPHISISGFYFLDLASNYTPAPDLQAFLDAGPPPVYIGFGSIVLDDPNAMTKLIFEAVKKTGQRVLLSKGWGGIGADELRSPNDVFILESVVPHDWLFKHVSCVVHHGGAGTTAAGITAGRPTLVVPFFGDQPFWGAMVARAGAGPDPIPHKQLTAEKLADAINFCLKPKSRERAQELAGRIAMERGSDMGAQSFHQFLEADRLRCTLAPSRPAAWRIKRTQVRLSAFAACTLANANLLDFHDLKLFRSQEYSTDEGPWDPISGGAAAVFGALSSMVMGLADFPSETLKAFHIPFRSSRQQQSQASVPTIAWKGEISHAGNRSPPPISPEQSQTSLNGQESVASVNLSGPSTPTSNLGSSSMSDALQDDASQGRFHIRNKASSSKDRDMLRQTGVHTSKGFGRIAKAALQSPVEISVGFTKGFHNAPKLWGDDTVRPQEQVSDLKSGVKAIGKEFGFGWYDGVTGLFTQPWNGAQKEGTSGFFKGIGKGMGGFVAKPGAALFGIPSYFMKGVHKEVQKLFGSNVQNYIVASRAAQGYEEWLQSTEAEKQDVIIRWKLIQKYLKQKRNPDEMLGDILETQRKMNKGDREAFQDCGGTVSTSHSAHSARTASSAQSANSAYAPTQDPRGNAMLVLGGSESPLHLANTAAPEESQGAAEIDEAIRLPVQETSRGDTEEDVNPERAAIQENGMSQLQRQRRQEATGQDNLRQAMATSEAEAQRHAREALEYEEQLKRVMAQSLMEQRQRGSHGSLTDQRQRVSSDMEWESDIGPNDDEHDEELFERGAKGNPEEIAEKARVQQPAWYDPGHLHLAGTTQSEFEALQQRQGQRRGEKTTQEKTEEEVVIAYVKKQSLLEQQHRHKKGKGRATATATAIEGKDDESLQEALKLSMQRHEHDAEYHR
jgi:UDP:flavonoid glycosyltransferase YjiC (YdhE family)